MILDHPLDGEELIVSITHVPTGLVGEATNRHDVRGIYVPQGSIRNLTNNALDDLLKKIEEAGGG